MRKFLLNYGLLSLICVLSCIAVKAQADTYDDQYGTLFWHTDFTNADPIDRETAYGITDDFLTEDGDWVTINFYGVGIYPNGNNSKFPDYTGYMQTAKYPEEYNPSEDGSPDIKPYAVTEPISSIKTIEFTQAATGNNRGIKISVKGDGDDDWVVIWDTYINEGPNCQSTEEGGKIDYEIITGIDRTNCQIKFESLDLAQYAFLLDISVYSEPAPDTYTLSFYPEDGAEVTSLSQVTVSWDRKISCSGNYINGVTITNDENEEVAYSIGSEVSNDLYSDAGSCTIVFNREITTPGTYKVTIPEGYFTVEPDNDNLEEIILTYNIPGSDGIKSAINDATGEDKYYNLNGQRVTTPSKGIYILNGNKVVVK